MSPRAFVGVLIVVACGTSPVSPDGGGQGGGDAGGGAAGGGMADLIPPTVASTTPATGATGVAVDSDVTITFSEAMTPGSVTLTGAPAVSFSPPAMDGDGTRFIFTPAAPLVVSTTYTLTVAGTDLAGNALAGLASFSFTTRGPPDLTAPTVSGFLPTGTAVAHDAGVTITFSERMDPGSVSLQLAPSVLLELPTFDTTETVATFAATFEPSTTYSATVAGNDAAGNALTGTTVFTFTTAPLPDTTRPTVRSISPADQSTAPQNTRVTVTFSERMNTSATEAAFSMRKQGGASVPGTFQWGLGGSLQLTFDPTTDLDPSSVYLVSVGTGARDTSNNTLLSAFSAQFTTAAARDTTPPQVTGVTPVSGSTGLSRCDWSFAITFSESMDVLSTQAAVTVSQTTPAKTIPLSAEWNRDATRLTVSRRLSGSLIGDCFDYGAAVRLEIATSADDLAGNRLAAVFSSTATAIRKGTVNPMATVGLSRSIFESGSFNTTALWAGEANPAGNAVRTLLSFQVTLPASSVITQATLKVRLAEGGGLPFSSLGPIFVDSVDYGTTHEPTDFDTPVLESCVTVPPPTGCAAFGFHRQFATDGWSGERTLDVTRAVFADLKRGTRSQFRLKFLMESSNNGTLDYVRFAGAPDFSESQYYPRLTVTYEYP